MATLTRLSFAGDDNSDHFISTNPLPLGDVTALWRNARDADEVYDAVCDLPGFGEQKARIFVALLGKQMGVTPTGWEAVAGPYALPGHRSVADVTDRDSLGRVRMYK